MLDLWRVEWYKLRHSTYFWVLLGLFILFLIAMPWGAEAILDLMSKDGATLRGFSPKDIPLFDFVDIWQNLTFAYKSFSIFLGFIIIISITAEYSHGTFRQQVMDGWSPARAISAKFSLIVVLSALVSLAVLLIGLVLGLLYSPVTDMESILAHIEFIPAYFLHLIAFQSLCMLIAMLVKRSGIAIALTIFWVYLIEPIAGGLIEYWAELPYLAGHLPFAATGALIANPFPKLLLQQTLVTVPWHAWLFHLGYTALIMWGCYLLMTKRDVK